MKLNRSKDNKWIFQKNISSKELMENFLSALEILKNEINTNNIKNILKDKFNYKGRSQEGSKNTMGVRLSQMCFYMIGYKKNGIFLPSVTTQLFLKNKEKMNELFLINLFSMQFPSPYSKTPENFQLYIGRFIIKLLLDKRIEEKLYIDEVIWFLPFIEKINETLYEELILEILKYRKLSYDEKLQLFHEIEEYDEVFSNCLHEINYYFVPIFEKFGVLQKIEDQNHNNGKIFKFRHGNKNTYRNDSVVSRKKVPGYFKLNDNILEKAKTLNKIYSVYDEPENEKTMQNKDDWIRELYEFKMLDYIQNIDNDKLYSDKVVNLIKQMVYHSKYGTNDGKSFEENLKPIFELFRENEYVEIQSGAGNTDLLCNMIDNESIRYKVNVDAKKSKNRLQVINAMRIEKHIEDTGARYCIIIAPKFSKGAQTTDIKKHKIVTLEAETLANYCLKECLASEDGLADYTEIDNIIKVNQGSDISKLLNNLIESKYQV